MIEYRKLRVTIISIREEIDLLRKGERLKLGFSQISKN